MHRIFISLTVVDEFSVFAVVAVQWKISGDRLCIVAESRMESKTKNIKNSLGAPPNAKHSTLLQGCFFSVFVFNSIHDSVTMHGVSHHLASPMAAIAFVSVPIDGFSTES